MFRINANVTVRTPPPATPDAADAARLYGEVQRRAEESVTRATLTKFGVNNECSVLRWAHDYSVITDQDLVKIVFRLNGADYRVTADMRREYADRRALAEAVAARIASEITSELLGTWGSRMG